MENKEQVLKFIADSLQEMKDFAIEQAPDVVQQYLGWKFTEAVMFTCLGLILLIPALYGCYKATIITKQLYKEDSNEPWFLLCILAIIGLMLFPTLFIINNLPDAIQIHYYPKAYLLEQLLK